MPERASLTGGHCQQPRSACRISAIVLSGPFGAPGSAQPDAGSIAAASTTTPSKQAKPHRLAAIAQRYFSMVAFLT